MAACQIAHAGLVRCAAPSIRGHSRITTSSRSSDVKVLGNVNLHRCTCVRRVVTCNKKAKLLGQFSNWSIPTTRPRVCPVSDTIQRQSQGVVACASESSPPSSQSDSSLLKTEAQITSTWSDHVDLQSESVSNPRRQGSSFLLEFAVGCLVAALLPATSYWLFLRRQNIRPECQPPVTSVSIVYRPSSEKPSHLPFSQETEQITIQQRSKQHDSSHTDLEVAPYQRNPSLLSGTGAFRASLAREFTEDHASGLLATEQEVWQLERVASGLQTGPSGRDASPSRNFEGSHESPNAQVSANTDARISFNSSQRLVDTFRTRLVWDSGAVEPAGMTMTSASHQLPFVNPPVSTDPFASRAVWDTGREPAQAASSISAPETPPPADSPWSSAVRLCSHNRRGSPFRLVLRFPTKGNSFVRDVAKRVGPSVVRINTERSQPTEAGGKDLFSKFFGGEDLALEERTKDREQGQGSGFVVDGRKGIIVTNAHVINRADTVLVTFTDGRTFRGVVVGTDELTDLAVIRVELPQWESLPKAPLGDSNSLEVGDWVIAVGNPFGLDNTVTLGIVSCLHRQAAEIGIPEKRVDFLQTDCAINPGNSGGPLLNEFGKVVGINTAIRADAEGISFAIPINFARKIVDVLSEGLPVRHAYIGVQVVTITPGLARQHNTEPGSRGVLPEIGGLLVANVADGSPAEAAGLRSGDVILEMNGRPLRSTGELQCVVAYSDVGQVIKVKTRRGQETIVLNVVAGDLTPLLSAKDGGSPRQK